MQLQATQGLNRSPMRAAFHGRPTAPFLKLSKKEAFVWLFVVAERTKAEVQMSSNKTMSKAGKSKRALYTRRRKVDNLRCLYICVVLTMVQVRKGIWYE